MTTILLKLFCALSKIHAYKTGVINDPLGQIHSLASRESCFRLKFVLFWKVGTNGRRLDGRTQWSLPAVTVGRPGGSKCYHLYFQGTYAIKNINFLLDRKRFNFLTRFGKILTQQNTWHLVKISQTFWVIFSWENFFGLTYYWYPYQ